jgi:hypothetical protein
MEKKLRNSLIRSTLLLTLALTLFSGLVTFGQGIQRKPLPPPKMVCYPDTVVRQIAVDILRLETIVVQQDSTIKDLRSSIVEKDSAKAAMDTMLTEGQFREKVLLAANEAEQKKTGVWKSEATKYKRQRNVSLGAVGIVVVAGIVKSVKTLLER